MFRHVFKEADSHFLSASLPSLRLEPKFSKNGMKAVVLLSEDFVLLLVRADTIIATGDVQQYIELT